MRISVSDGTSTSVRCVSFPSLSVRVPHNGCPFDKATSTSAFGTSFSSRSRLVGTRPVWDAVSVTKHPLSGSAIGSSTMIADSQTERRINFSWIKFHSHKIPVHRPGSRLQFRCSIRHVVKRFDQHIATVIVPHRWPNARDHRSAPVLPMGPKGHSYSRCFMFLKMAPL